MTPDQTGLSPAAALLRRQDPDRFRFALFAPPSAREALFTLYAFNHEVAKTRESVSETMIGGIRLQWWRESIEGIYGGVPRQHEIVLPLAACIEAYSLSRNAFDGLINARERDLEDRPMDDLSEAERYLRAATEPLIELAGMILDPAGKLERNGLADIAAGHAFMGKLRATGHLEAARRPFFPRSLLEKHGGSPRKFSELKMDEGCRSAVREMADHALALTARGLARTRKERTLAPLLLPARQTRSRGSQLAKLRYDPFDMRFAGPDPLEIWRFWLSRFSGRY
ncbi:squalene/phytoene synthase family protein [Nisaea acidiphila]|uniref:Squalene/phytoene synthase family protein n=1 Tax=Nisaea acidiphila TaxID=1862145 RepID=A0A9J7AUW5_9PROT|nr:squalene/phytoene synthase family protein [Nisaea acidiphila]UUX50108.1 squalene/phytoene synthase family protein [Nisaea acidiphila]